MKRIFILFYLLLAKIALFGILPTSIPPTQPTANLARGQIFLTQNAVFFEENKGQLTGEDATRVRFFHKQGNFSAFLLKTGIALQVDGLSLVKNENQAAQHNGLVPQGFAAPQVGNSIQTYRMDLVLVGANPNPKITAEGKSEDYTVYHSHNPEYIHHYRQVVYLEIYPHIDWVISLADGQLKNEFVVRPGGDPSLIKFETRWEDDFPTLLDGFITPTDPKPASKESNRFFFKNPEPNQTRFALKDKSICLETDGYAQKNEAIKLGPDLKWGTYFGGASAEMGISCTTDAEGNLYMTGTSCANVSIAQGGHQSTVQGSMDAFLVKYSPNGHRLWTIYFGGEGYDRGYSCATDAAGNVFVAGTTNSKSGIAHGGHQNTLSGFQDAFLVKFDATGAIQWSTYYGGTSFEDGFSCASDALGNIYLVGNTASVDGIATLGHQSDFGGDYDAFIAKFDGTGRRVWASYYGGTGFDSAHSCAVDTQNNVYLCGETFSTKNIAFQGHQSTNSGGLDAFLVKFTASGQRQWGSYYGGEMHDAAYSCATDQQNNIFLVGNTASTHGIGQDGHQTSLAGDLDAFVVKFNSAGARQWGTYYGGGGMDKSRSCSTDAFGNVFVVGKTESSHGIAYRATQTTHREGSDAFLVKINGLGALVWGTYHGGGDSDNGHACTVSPGGDVYLVGNTASARDIALGGNQNAFGGGKTDAFIAKFAQEDTMTKRIESAAQNKPSTRAYPNPTSSILHIEFSETIPELIQVFDNQGVLMMEKKPTAFTELLPVEHFPPGIYWLVSKSKESTLHTLRWAKF